MVVGTAARPSTRSGGRDDKGVKCPGFTEIMRKVNPCITDRKKMKLPATYQGACEKELIAAGGRPRRLNMLDDEDLDDSDSESDFDTPITPGSIRALTTQTLTYDISDEPTPLMSVTRQPTITKNSFKALAEDDDTELDGEALDALNGWAHKVNRSSERLSKLARAPQIWTRLIESLSNRNATSMQ